MILIIAIVDQGSLDDEEKKVLKEILNSHGFKRTFLRISKTYKDQFESLMRLPDGVFINDSPSYSNSMFEQIKNDLISKDILVPIAFFRADGINGFMFVWHGREL